MAILSENEKTNLKSLLEEYCLMAIETGQCDPEECASCPVTMAAAKNLDPKKDKWIKIGVTMEKTIRVYQDYYVTEDMLNNIKDGEAPFFDEMVEECQREHGDVDFDYAVCDANGMDIVPWNKSV